VCVSVCFERVRENEQCVEIYRQRKSKMTYIDSEQQYLIDRKYLPQKKREISEAKRNESKR